MDADRLKSNIYTRVYNALKTQFDADISQGTDYQPIGEALLSKLATAISEMATDIVTEITSNAQVQPGISVSTSGGNGSTTGTGQIS